MPTEVIHIPIYIIQQNSLEFNHSGEISENNLCRCRRRRRVDCAKLEGLTTKWPSQLDTAGGKCYSYYGGGGCGRKRETVAGRTMAVSQFYGGSNSLRKIKVSPYIKIILCFLLPILVGSLLLWLPFSTSGDPLAYIDALFLATSGICVTGLSPVDVGTTLTIFGQCVMAILIEIGGLSVLTIACFLILSVQKRLNYSTQTLMMEMLNQDTMDDIKTLIKKIVLFSLGVQCVGAIVNVIVFLCYFDDVGFAIRAALFHTVSSYNNAGFDILGTGDSLLTLTSEMPAALNAVFKINTMLLITVGGIGIIFLDDCIRKRSWKRLNISTKIVLVMTGSIILFGGLLFKLFFYADGQDVPLLECFFLAVSSRTAGFDNVGLSESTPAAVQTLLILLMYIGASPCSTGGGVKTTTFFIVLAVIAAFIRGKTPTFSYKRISSQSIMKALVLIVFSILYILLVSTLIGALEGDECSVQEIVFEVVSAFSTTGLSLGITSSVGVASKLVLCLTMFLGRVGVLTFLSSMNKSWIFAQSEDEVRYVDENIIVG